MQAYVELVRDFSAAVLLFHGAVAERFALHATDLRALRTLAEKPMTAGALAGSIGLTNAAVTALLDRLESAGYVRRERDVEDRRRVTVRIVPSAVRELDRLYAGVASRMTKLLGSFDDTALAAVLDYLDGATDVLKSEIDAIAQRR